MAASPRIGTKARMYLAAVNGAGAALIILSAAMLIRDWPPEQAWLFAGLTLMIGLATARLFELRPKAKISIRAAPQFMAAILLPLPEALLATGIGIIAGYALQLRRTPHDFTDLSFNAAQGVLATGAAVLVYRLVLGALPGSSTEPIALLAAAASLYLANVCLVAIVVALTRQDSGFIASFVHLLRQDPLLYTSLLVTGIVGVIIVRDQAYWALLLLVIPLLLMEHTAARHRQEAEREHKIAVMEEINALRNDFVAAVTHDLRTPLTVIKGYGELLAERDDELMEDERTAVAGINLNAERLGELIEMLLQLSELDAGMVSLERKPSDVPALIRRVFDGLRFLADSKQTALNLTVEPGLPPFELDAPRFEQVLTNVLDNAIRFTPQGGEIDVSARLRDDALVVEMADSGPGIAPENLPHIFDRFYRVPVGDNLRRRTGGLGLTVAKSIVELHGGTITARSMPRQGAVFVIELPCPPAAVRRPDEAATLEPAYPTQSQYTRPLPHRR